MTTTAATELDGKGVEAATIAEASGASSISCAATGCPAATSSPRP